MGQGWNKGDLKLFSSTESAVQCEGVKMEIKQAAEEERIQDYHTEYKRRLGGGHRHWVSVVAEFKMDISLKWMGVSGHAQNSSSGSTSCLTSTLCQYMPTPASIHKHIHSHKHTDVNT